LLCTLDSINGDGSAVILHYESDFPSTGPLHVQAVSSAENNTLISLVFYVLNLRSIYDHESPTFELNQYVNSTSFVRIYAAT